MIKTLYYTYGFYGTLFLDESGDLVCYVHENDGDWNEECFSFIPKYFSGNLVQLKRCDIEDDEPWGNEEKIKKWFKKTVKKQKEK